MLLTTLNLRISQLCPGSAIHVHAVLASCQSPTDCLKAHAASKHAGPALLTAGTHGHLLSCSELYEQCERSIIEPQCTHLCVHTMRCNPCSGQHLLRSDEGVLGLQPQAC